MPNLSIVIPIRNGAELLVLQLDALHEAIGNRTDGEVVIADNGSTDDTVSIVRSYEDRLSIRIADASRSPGINVARNAGVRAASGERILLCDADWHQSSPSEHQEGRLPSPASRPPTWRQCAKLAGLP